MAAQDSNLEGGRYNTPDYSGLQFNNTRDQYAQGLEVDYRASAAYPQPIHKTDLDEKPPNAAVYPVAPPYYQASPHSHGREVLPTSSLPSAPTGPKGRSRKFWILIGAGVATVIIAVVVGCVVGLVVVPNGKKAES